MKKIIIIAMMALSASFIRAISLEEIISLHEAQVGEIVLLEVIEANDVSFQLSTEQIIHLKRKGLSEKVIAALIKRGKVQKQKQEETATQQNPYGRELTPFDQFFLSTYYSHQYGWPAPNYQSPREILESGLFYQEPDIYPNSRVIRIYGYGHSCPSRTRWHHIGQRRYCSSGSLYSVIVPAPRVLGQRNYVTLEDFQNSSNDNENQEPKHGLGLDTETIKPFPPKVKNNK